MNEKPTILDKISRVISIAGNAVLMNLYFLVCSIVVPLMGQSFTALLTAVRYNIRGDKWQDGFKAGMKNRFWRGTIAWCIMATVDVYFMLDVVHCIISQAPPVPTVSACVVFLLMTMVTFALQILNVYVPTGIGDWVRNAVNMVFTVPLELAICALAFWMPVLMAFLWPFALWYTAMIFIVAYFVLMATATTMLLKNALIQYLVDARAEGTLIADDGKKKEADEEETDDENEDA